jgi:glyoxylase-like metal-dependent hydrolase (beta-lactamase superfamily II)
MLHAKGEPAPVVTDLRITVLVDDAAGNSRLGPEHGLSLWIEADGRKVLFDTGQGQALEPNAQQLAVDLGQADAVVISHGHYDHTGGLLRALARSPKAIVYIHPLAFESKYARGEESRSRAIGIPEPVAGALLEGDHRLTFTRLSRKTLSITRALGFSQGLTVVLCCLKDRSARRFRIMPTMSGSIPSNLQGNAASLPSGNSKCRAGIRRRAIRKYASGVSLVI